MSILYLVVGNDDPYGECFAIYGIYSRRDLAEEIINIMAENIRHTFEKEWKDNPRNAHLLDTYTIDYISKDFVIVPIHINKYIVLNQEKIFGE